MQEHPNQLPKRNRRTGLWIALAVGLIVIIAFCAIVASAANQGSRTVVGTSAPSAPSPNAPATGKWTVTHTYSGDGIKKTEIITVPDDWKIAYTCQGMSANGITATANLIVSVYGEDGSIQDVAINETCSAGKTTSGITEEHQGGQVYLDINADSRWMLKVQELK